MNSLEERIKVLEERNINLGEANKELRKKVLDLEDEIRKLKLEKAVPV